jgi:hypothetical protein
MQKKQLWRKMRLAVNDETVSGLIARGTSTRQLSTGTRVRSEVTGGSTLGKVEGRHRKQHKN